MSKTIKGSKWINLAKFLANEKKFCLLDKEINKECSEGEILHAVIIIYKSFWDILQSDRKDEI